MNRRTYLALAGAPLSAGCASGVGSGIVGTPETDTRVKTVRGEIIKRVDLYESGAAEITLADDHGCLKRIAFTHTDLPLSQTNTNDALRIWQAPDFGGPVTVDLKSAIQTKDGYPSRRFELKLIGEQGMVCMGWPPAEIEFTVPKSYMP